MKNFCKNSNTTIVSINHSSADLYRLITRIQIQLLFLLIVTARMISLVVSAIQIQLLFLLILASANLSRKP